MKGDGNRGEFMTRKDNPREGEICYDIPYMQNRKRSDVNELIY